MGNKPIEMWVNIGMVLLIAVATMGAVING
ncbi:hypothetical protein [Hafnia phage Pocis76]|uniref:Uncharacterized protein n=1 Tax=Hafnia phage Pocis76 TaxID=2831174 RepID=A0A8E7FMF5_9CAUD|nr:hypothetical protein [Hafnia phage Pocis76]